MRTAKALARLRGCAGLHGPSLVAYELAQLISPGSATKILTDMPRMTTCETMAIFYSFIDGLGERGGSVVECRTPEREVRGSRPTAAVLCP